MSVPFLNKPVFVVLAGGRGERFWPLSRRRFPKQLLPFYNHQSLLQMTIARICDLIENDRIYVVANADYGEEVAGQLPMLPQENIILEPESKNTAPAMGLAALIIKERFQCEDPVLIFIPSDLLIEDGTKYHNFIKTVVQYAQTFKEGVICGTVPTRPETGFGYIQAGMELHSFQGFDYRKVIAFKEKPDYQSALDYLQSGYFLWNSGVFVWRTASLLRQYQSFLPEIIDRLHQAVKSLRARDLQAFRRHYLKISPVSFDEGILEHASGMCVFIVDYRWDDLGNWNAWAQYWPAGTGNNRVQGIHFGIETENCLIYSPSKLVATLGVSNLVIVETGDSLLICDRNKVQDIKRLVNSLKEAGKEKFL